MHLSMLSSQSSKRNVAAWVQMLREVRKAAQLDEERRGHLLALAYLEAALTEQLYGVTLKASEYLAQAHEAAGFFAELSGEKCLLPGFCFAEPTC